MGAVITQEKVFVWSQLGRLFRTMNAVRIVVHIREKTQMTQSQGCPTYTQLQRPTDRTPPRWGWQIQPQQHFFINHQYRPSVDEGEGQMVAGSLLPGPSGNHRTTITLRSQQIVTLCLSIP
jgi:hypothetical protein